MAYNRGERPDSPMKRRGGRRRKKVCVFCGKENNEIDYKDVAKLRNMFLKEENPSKKNHRKLCKTSESTDSCYQESTSYVYDAIHSGLILKMINAAPHLAEQHFCIIYENCYITE